MGVRLTVNGAPVEVRADGSTPLILALRNELGLKGTRFGCGGVDCGACMVLVDSEPRYSCTLQLDDVARNRVTTIEGLNDALAEVLREAILAVTRYQPTNRRTVPWRRQQLLDSRAELSKVPMT